jgi:hypothetical protein
MASVCFEAVIKRGSLICAKAKYQLWDTSMVVLAKSEHTLVTTLMAIEVDLHIRLRDCTCMLVASSFVYLFEIFVTRS